MDPKDVKFNDANGNEFGKGDIVTIRFKVVGEDQGLVLIEPLGKDVGGMPGLTAVNDTNLTVEKKTTDELKKTPTASIPAK